MFYGLRLKLYTEHKFLIYLAYMQDQNNQSLCQQSDN
jgi:hypothetical protein